MVSIFGLLFSLEFLVAASTPGRCATLSDGDHKLLEDTYMASLPCFVESMIKPKQELPMQGRSLFFPNKSEWTPPPPLRSTDYKELLMDPANDVVLHDKLSITDPKTHKVISHTVLV